MVRNDYAAAIPLLQRAIDLDPNFAMAYAQLGSVYSNTGELGRAAEALRKAYDLRERVSEREKFYIVSRYEFFVTGDLEAARRSYELWAQTYPRDPIPPGSLNSIYTNMGEYDKALAAALQVMKLDSGRGISYTNLLISYLLVNRLDEARATAQEAQSRDLDNPINHINLYAVDFLQHDEAGMVRESAALMGKAGFEDAMLYSESDTAAYRGKFSDARALTRRATESALRAEEKETAASYRAESALREALAGNANLAKDEARAALALSHGKDVAAVSAAALALAGDMAQAARLAAEISARFPRDTIVQRNYLPTIRAASALHSITPARADGGRAIQALQEAVSYELGAPAQTVSFALYICYLRGLSYLTTHDGNAAAAEFQKILDHPGVVSNEPIAALAHLGQARAYALAGDREKAAVAYQDFLSLWKDADTDLPIFNQAKAEYGKLKIANDRSWR
jgi:tetratricopeptide (TPR) repeat protein